MKDSWDRTCEVDCNTHQSLRTHSLLPLHPVSSKITINTHTHGHTPDLGVPLCLSQGFIKELKLSPEVSQKTKVSLIKIPSL